MKFERKLRNNLLIIDRYLIAGIIALIIMIGRQKEKTRVQVLELVCTNLCLWLKFNRSFCTDTLFIFRMVVLYPYNVCLLNMVYI